MQDPKGRSTVQVLEDFHTDLGRHFRALHEERKLLSPAAPVFALEHGLGDADLDLLKNAVRSAVRQGFGATFRQWWLPFVVYAAESGYEYAGGEYWQTFEESTPWWHEYGDRDRIRGWFQVFAVDYGGAVPQGAFAEYFTIIAWPITHAVLPVYLQRNLARLLFDFRTGLTAQLLQDPDALWERAWLLAPALTPSGSGCSARTRPCSARSPWLCCPVRTTNRRTSCARHSAGWLTGCPRSATHGSGWRRPAGRRPSFARVRAASSGTSGRRRDRRGPSACPARLTRVSFSAAGATDGRRTRSFPTSVRWSCACRIWLTICAAAAPASRVPSGLSSREDSCSFPATKCGLRAGPARESRSSAWNARRTRSTT